MRRRGARSPIPWLGALWLGGCAGAAVAHEPVVAIVLDDLGPGWRQGRRAVTLPGAVTCAFLPHTPHAQGLARLAHAEGKEVMLHLPMQPVDARPLGPGGLILDMTRAAFVRRLRDDLRAVPHVRGVNNHMGSLLTRHPGHMAWLMRELGRGRLYFVDSRTTAATVARRLARERGVRNTERDVFLDNRRSPGAIRAQLHALLAQARRRGTATAIGHPYPETLAV
ncbi:MAG: divergent polysaccharide deacetylase family protein, partial [Gammaproteobacteria bacterium]|nr:divergent polysaccharide deacetylase family protein [Gammaproteobacteria bacterium]